jgi:hypothetical protein
MTKNESERANEVVEKENEGDFQTGCYRDAQRTWRMIFECGAEDV